MEQNTNEAQLPEFPESDSLAHARARVDAETQDPERPADLVPGRLPTGLGDLRRVRIVGGRVLYPSRSSAVTRPPRMAPPPPLTFLERIALRIERARTTPAEERQAWTPCVPFPFDGPLIPRPEDKAEAARIFDQAQRALGLTTRELAELLGENLRTVEKWRQARAPVDAVTWRLLQLFIRFPDVRQALADSRALGE